MKNCDCDSMLFRRKPKTWKQALKDIHSNNIYTVRFASAARGLRFRILQRMKASGKSETNMIRPAKDIGLVTVQRFFIVDSHSVDTAVESIRIAKPDVVEIMPGVVCKKIHEFSDKVRNTPILAGGLIEFKEDVDNAIEAGATAVSTANRQLWDYR